MNIVFFINSYVFSLYRFHINGLIISMFFSEGSDEILREIRAGYVSYVVNTRSILSGVRDDDGLEIRRCAVQNGVTMFTSLDAARILLDVLEETLPRIATI